MPKGGGTDGKFFQTTKKGEIHELSVDLNSTDKSKVKDAIKKVIACMTVGKDVSMLFPHVIKSMGTDNIELKKLVYLYIINYARSQPEKAILVVNMFQKDARSHPNPLVRALAIRTMGCIRVDRITEYLCDPLGHALKDEDPYVRKTAAISTAKLYSINAEMVEERGFIEKLRGLLSDANPMVVANAVASLAEISQSSGQDLFKISAGLLTKLLTALNECTEWGRVFILDALALYKASAREASDICERVTPQLQHANSAVVMSAVKVILRFIDQIPEEDASPILMKKLAPPLVTLLSAQPEIQYVALRNINLIVQKYPKVLANEIRVFFCKYNDASYVKMEKLETMIKLANEKNIDQVLLEFKEYAQEVDVDFVRRAVSAIGRCAIKLQNSAQKCVETLMDLVQSRGETPYVVQEAVIVIKDIFRRYPRQYEKVISTLCENLDTLDEPEAKASMIWIVGEYAERLTDAAERLSYFIEDFAEENAMVQLQILTATVKLFLKKPEEGKDMVTKVLNMATENSDNPDLRDRGYVYWRLLSTDPAAAKAVVLAERPVISSETFQMDSKYLATLMDNISSLASVYHKPPETFVRGIKKVTFEATGPAAADSDSSDSGSSGDSSDSSDSSDEDEKAAPKSKKKKKQAAPAAAAPAPLDLLDLGSLMGGGGAAPAPVAAAPALPAASADPLGSLFDMVPSQPAPSAASKVVVPRQQGNGLQLSSSYAQQNGKFYLNLTFDNGSSAPVNSAALRINKNSLGVANANMQNLLTQTVAPGTSFTCPVELRPGQPAMGPQASANLQFALKTNLGVLKFQDAADFSIFFTGSGAMEQQTFLGQWKALTEEKTSQLQSINTGADLNAINGKLAAARVFNVAQRKAPNKPLVYLYYSTALLGQQMMVEVAVMNTGATRIVAKAQNSWLAEVTRMAVHQLLQ